ncbi:hypothetical protein MRS44_011009 [Fusarium solani]|uniref:uncharacterized protein n=1 Tax=Fusarium solani TaxID=169388 RepID=UPI0032C41AD6|nr:hypothetical protein MRS44_011009 [Fusarium solani]
MNDDREVFIFHEWFQDYSGTMGSPAVALQFYDKDTSRFAQTLENQSLRAAIQRYKETQPKNDFWENFDPDSCSWDQVVAELDETTSFYRTKAEGNAIRRSFRGPGVSRNMGPLLESIPQDNGLGVLKGGLLIIFNVRAKFGMLSLAVKRRADTCERIFESFEHIPSCIEDAEQLRQTYSRDESVFSAVGNLYSQLVKAIPLLIDVLLRKSNNSKDKEIKKFGKSVFGDSLAEVDGILKPVKSAEDMVKQCRLRLDTKGIAKNYQCLQGLHVEVQSVKQHIDQINQRFTTMEERFETCRAEDKEERRRLASQPIQLVGDLKNVLYAFFQEGRRAERLSLEAGSYRAIGPSPRLSRGDVMEAIRTEAERATHLRDLSLVLRKYHEFSSKALSRANYLMVTPKFQSWLMSPESEMLLVDGHCGDQSIGKVAPTSVFCSGLVQTLSGPLHDPSLTSLPRQPQIVLHFFAGQHTNPSAGLYGPRGLIRSLIDQLLMQWPGHEHLNLTFLEREFLGRITSDDLETSFLCYIFERLVSQLGFSSPLCCIVDGLSHFETSLWGWADDLMMIIDSFFACMHHEAGIVKFLLVSPERSTRVRHRIPEDYHVDLRAGNFHARSPGQSLVVDITEMESSWHDS